VPHLGDHRLFGTVVVAASSDLTLFLSAVEAAFGPRACVLEELCFLRPLVLPGDGARTIQVVLAPEDDGAYSLRLVSRAAGPEPHDADAWTLHVTGRLRLPDALPRAAVDHDALRRRCTLRMSGPAFYELAWAPGANTGSAFRWIETIWQGDNEAVARTAPPPLAEVPDLYPLAPGAIEACFQTLFFGGAFETRALAEGGVAYVPFTIGRFAFFGRPGDQQLWCHGQARARYAVDAPSKAGDALLFDEAGRVVVEIAGFEVRQLRRQAVREALGALLHADTAQVGVLALDWPTYLGALPTGTRPRLLDRLAHRGAPPADAVRRSSHKTPYLEGAKAGDLRGQLIEYLRESVAQMVGLPAAEVRDDTAFLDLGMDSIGALVLANRIRADLGISVSMATVIAAVNLPALAAAIAVA
jgi:aryl carrier-like protein